MQRLMIVTAAAMLAACGSSDKREDPPEYFYAKEGKPLVFPAEVQTPDLRGALVIPKAELPLQEYNPDLVKPPVVISTPEPVAQEEREEKEDD